MWAAPLQTCQSHLDPVARSELRPGWLEVFMYPVGEMANCACLSTPVAWTTSADGTVELHAGALGCSWPLPRLALCHVPSPSPTSAGCRGALKGSC